MFVTPLVTTVTPIQATAVLKLMLLTLAAFVGIEFVAKIAA